MSRTFGIARVSTLEQETAVQEDERRRAAKAFGLEPITILSEPEGTSGRKTRFANRPMGRYLMHRAQTGDCIVVTKCDRLARSILDLRFVLDYFDKRDVRIIILNALGGEALDMNNSTHKMIVSFLGIIAEFEGDLISSRTREALQYRKRNGLAYSKTRWHVIVKQPDGTKLMVWDRQLFDQMFDTVLPLRAAGVSCQVILELCKTMDFRDGKGKRWWYCAKSYNTGGSHAVHRYLLAIRRLAAAGELPPEYLARWPKALGPAGEPKKRKPRQVPQPVVPSEADREIWSAAEWQKWYAANRDAIETGFVGADVAMDHTSSPATGEDRLAPAAAL